MPKAVLLALCCALAAPAGAAGPAEGRGVALGEAELRFPDARLVEIEGFTDVTGDIPCKGRSYSRVWHYKYYVPSSKEWLVVNVCGDGFVNAAKHIPYSKADEPTVALQGGFAKPDEVLDLLQAQKIFTPVYNQFSLDVRMQVRMHPERDGRPAGCYWTVSQEKAKAMADCAGEKAWNLAKGKPRAAASEGPAKPVKKARDPAGRYARVAVDFMKKRYPDARLVYVEALAEGDGSAKCVSTKDGWIFVFATKTAGFTAVEGCNGKTTAQLADMDGRLKVNLAKHDEIILPFRDSDWAMAQVPAGCAAGKAAVVMRLANYKAGHSPAAGRSQVWAVSCGDQKHYVDALTGQAGAVGLKAE